MTSPNQTSRTPGGAGNKPQPDPTTDPQTDPASDLGRKEIEKGADPQLGRKEIYRGPPPGGQRGVISELGRKEINKSEDAKAENAGRKDIDRTDAR